METVTLSTLVADTGETPRVLNHWTDIGILRPQQTTDRQGRGNRRFYAAEPLYGERKYALLASAMNKLRLPLVDIKHLIYADRLSFDPVDDLRKYADPKHLEFALRNRASLEESKKKNPTVHPYEAALAGEANIFTVITTRQDDQVWPFRSVLLRQDELDPEMAERGNNNLMLNLMADTTTAVVLNLSKIFEPLYRKSAPVEADDRAHHGA
jgi:DNA-binding transcriptional MerR regulator